MKPQKCLIATVLLTILEVVLIHSVARAQLKADVATRPGKNGPFSAQRVGLRKQHPWPLEQAYQDAVGILSANNSCSRFFGGPQAADKVLSQLIAQLQIHLLRDSRTGIEMSGTFTYFGQSERRLGYRLFTRATINIRGPFFKAKVFPSEPLVPRVGSFLPNTREVRVLILLHELAHLIKGLDGSWLIPDDGNAPELSSRNTALIESQCRPQILSLSQKVVDQLVKNQSRWRSNWS